MAERRSAGVVRSKGNILRLLDANLNRAREGLRVIEDTARFLWNDEQLFKRLRRERHSIDFLTRAYYPKLLKSRNSREDEGRRILEARRKNVRGVVTANFRRCEESLRVLEEYGKILSSRAGGEFKKIRFRVYELEKETLAGR